MTAQDPSAAEEFADEFAAEFDALVERASAVGAFDALRTHVEARLAERRERAPRAAAKRPSRDGGKREPGAPDRFGMVGASPRMLEVYDLLERVVPTDVPVLIQGETGTGKELIARALHQCGPRKGKRMLAENCAAVPENLLESELFGHRKGSFTGATQDREGHFVAADGGTVFLDEIGDMPLPMQAKLLRVLQDGEVRPVGANNSRKVDVRIIAATHRDLVEAVRDGSFREDLLFRLNVITVHLPPLREREGDVARLVRALLPRIVEETGGALWPEGQPLITETALARLEAWSWPGNVRELENELRRAVALSDGTIDIDGLSPRIAG